jgi:hypothetical protein
MKRYRILGWDFDSRANSLKMEILDSWEENVKKSHKESNDQIIKSLIYEYGEQDTSVKVQNFIDLGIKSISVIAFHNKFFTEVRNSFIIGSYYPALTGACALGERILNHLLLTLRDDFKSSPLYKGIYRKSSFDDWELAISTLESWSILLPEAAKNFRILMVKRHKSIHFNPETDKIPRELALEAIQCLQKILGEQFSGFGPQPWFITDILGEIYLKKDWVSHPFIQKIYIPNSILVSYKHIIEEISPRFVIRDDLDHEEVEIDDEEFVRLRNENNRPPE